MPLSHLNPQQAARCQVPSRHSGKHVLTELTTNGYGIKMLSPAPPEVKLHTIWMTWKMKNRMRGQPRALEEDGEEPASETQLSLPAGGLWGEAAHVWHLMFTASTTGVLGPAGLHGSEQLPVTADRDSLDVRNRSRAGKDVLNRQSERVSGS